MLHCNGPFCKGKEWPYSRFSKHRINHIKPICKMCEVNKDISGFVPGICETCNKSHDCMFGAGIFCSRVCNSKKKSIQKRNDFKNISNLCKSQMC